jgi:hypothetical protein
VVSLLFCLLHVLFWQMYDWPRSLNVLPMDGAGIVQVLNITVAATMVLFGYISLFHARALLAPGLGRALSFGIVLFWIVRAASGAVFFDFSLESLLLFVAMGALYAVPQLGIPSARSPQASGAILTAAD